jgi:hypothetical protein
MDSLTTSKKSFSKKKSKPSSSKVGSSKLKGKKSASSSSGNTSSKSRKEKKHHHGVGGGGSSDDNDRNFLYDDTPIPDMKDYPSMPLHELPDPEKLLATTTKEIKALKIEAKKLFDEMETGKKGTEEEQQELLAIKREAQLEKLRGNELIKVEQLVTMGFDETVIREYLEDLNKQIRDEARAKQKDIRNLENNIDKMIQMNKEAEKAVTAAHGAYGPLIAKQQVLQAKLEQAEVELYALETKVEHRRNMKSVELASKSKFKDAIKDIVRKFKIRCQDHDLLREVLVKAGRSLETDMDMGSDSQYSDSDSSSGRSINDNGNKGVDVDLESSENDTSSNSDDFSVSVSSVES